MKRQRSTWTVVCALLCLFVIAACGSGKSAAPEHHGQAADTAGSGSAQDHGQTAEGEKQTAENGGTGQPEADGAKAGNSDDAKAGANDDSKAATADGNKSGTTGDSKTGTSDDPKTDVKDDSKTGAPGNSKSGAKDDSKPPSTATDTPADAGGQGKVHIVEIKDFAFSPSKLEIKAGDSVKFINRDEVRHTATADDKSFDTGLLGKDEDNAVTFAKEGEFTYYCKPHPAMKGTITVTAK